MDTLAWWLFGALLLLAFLRYPGLMLRGTVALIVGTWNVVTDAVAVFFAWL